MKKISDYIGIKEASDILGVTQNTLRNWERDRKISVVRNPFNKYRLYDKEELEQFLADIAIGE